MNPLHHALLEVFREDVGEATRLLVGAGVCFRDHLFTEPEGRRTEIRLLKVAALDLAVLLYDWRKLGPCLADLDLPRRHRHVRLVRAAHAYALTPCKTTRKRLARAARNLEDLAHAR
jgi:hypothetical protein